MGTAHVLGGALMWKCENASWEITLHVAQIVNTEQLQHYVLRNVVCCRYVIVNTVHKGDNKDDYDNNNNNNNNNNARIAATIYTLEK